MSDEQNVNTAPAQEPTQQEVQTPEAAQVQAHEIPWIETLPQAIRDIPELAGIADAEGFANRISDLAKAKQAPESYEFQVPEGLETQQEIMTRFKEVAKDAGLSQDQASKVLGMWHDLQLSAKGATEKAYATAEKQLQSDWGKDYEANMGLAKKAVVHFGGKELAQYLDASGMGNHLPLIKAFQTIGKALSEDSTVGLAAPEKPADIERWNGMPMLTFKM